MFKKVRFSLLIVVFLFAISANGAPMGYSINSDSDDVSNEDSLYEIDLATGTESKLGKLVWGLETRSDTEGLALDSDGNLWGIDDESRTLFQIDTGDGSIDFQNEIFFPGFPAGGSNDFGMTFGCDNSLYATSVTTQTLYRLSWEDQNGINTIIGSAGSLGANISAIAAIGNPTRLYGLSNGDSPSLYSIDTDTGVATWLFALGGGVGEYDEAGLAFDSESELWAITDRRLIDSGLPSQILSINIETKTTTVVSTTLELGFESLAISQPVECDPVVDNANVDKDPRIPTLNPTGRLLAVIVLMLTGMAVLRRRII